MRLANLPNDTALNITEATKGHYFNPMVPHLAKFSYKLLVDCDHISKLYKIMSMRSVCG